MVLPENVTGVASTGEDAEGRAGKAAETHCGARPVPGRLQSPDSHAHSELPADPTGMACAIPESGAPALCVLVTGATGGIGRELCAGAARDHGVFRLVGRSQDKLDELAKNLAERFGGRAHLRRRLRAAGRRRCAGVAGAGGEPAGGDAREQRRFRLRCALRGKQLGNANALVRITTYGAHGALPCTHLQRKRRAGTAASSMWPAWRGSFPGRIYVHVLRLEGVRQSFSSALHMELRPHGVHVTALCPGLFARRFGDNADAGGIACPGDHQRPARCLCGYPSAGLQPPAVLPRRAGVIVFGSRFVPRTWAAAAASALQKPGK